MTRLLLVVVFLLSACSEQAPPADVPATTAAVEAASGAVPAPPPVASVNDDVDAGARMYEHLCLPCHAAGGGYAGTMRLGERLGIEKSVLLERNDLAHEYVKTVVRQGLQMMPPFRPSEITDAELDTLAAYVVANEAG